MILEELPQILAVARISSSQEVQILTTVKNLSLEVINELKSHEPHLQEESPIDHLFQSIEETKETWTIPSGEKLLEPNLEVAKKYDTWSGLKQEMDQGYQDYIENWFQTIIASRNHSLLPQLVISYYLQQLVYHTLASYKVYFSNLNVNIFVILLAHGCTGNTHTLEGDLLIFFRQSRSIYCNKYIIKL